MEILDDLMVRVLSCLMEKSVTTPDYYPMTLNALTAACNQKSNRNPVMALDEKAVVRAMDSLREKQLACRILSTEFRVPKYEHWFDRTYSFTPTQSALLCELMLRGAQTAGELRSRASRMQPMDLATVEQTLTGLMDLEGGPFVCRLGRAPGQKEPRFMHLFSGPPDPEALVPAQADEKAVLAVRAEDERILVLEEELEEVEQQLAELSSRFETFKAQFE
ncbi:MAG: YceH family protein [Proteobacteria bacterium]|nr:YceH family protein [Pseudomonadota bacterium]